MFKLQSLTRLNKVIKYASHYKKIYRWESKRFFYSSEPFYQIKTSKTKEEHKELNKVKYNRLSASAQKLVTSLKPPLVELKYISNQLKELENSFNASSTYSQFPTVTKKLAFFVTQCIQLAQNTQKINTIVFKNTLPHPSSSQNRLFFNSQSIDANLASFECQQLKIALLDDIFQTGCKFFMASDTHQLPTQLFNLYLKLCMKTCHYAQTKNILQKMSQQKSFPNLETYHLLLQTSCSLKDFNSITTYFRSARHFFNRYYQRVLLLNLSADSIAGILTYKWYNYFFPLPVLDLFSFVFILIGFFSIRYFESLAIQCTPYQLPAFIKKLNPWQRWKISFQPHKISQESLDLLYNRLLIYCVNQNDALFLKTMLNHNFDFKPKITNYTSERIYRGLIFRSIDQAFNFLKLGHSEPRKETLLVLTRELHNLKKYEEINWITKNCNIKHDDIRAFTIKALSETGKHRVAIKLAMDIVHNYSIDYPRHHNCHQMLPDYLKICIVHLEKQQRYNYLEKVRHLLPRTPNIFIWLIHAHQYDHCDPFQNAYSKLVVYRVIDLLIQYVNQFPDYQTKTYADVVYTSINVINSHREFHVALGIFNHFNREYYHTFRKVVESKGFSPEYIMMIRGILYEALVAAKNIVHGLKCHQKPSSNIPRTYNFVLGEFHQSNLQTSDVHKMVQQILNFYKAALRPLETIPPHVLNIVKETSFPTHDSPNHDVTKNKVTNDIPNLVLNLRKLSKTFQPRK